MVDGILTVNLSILAVTILACQKCALVLPQTCSLATKRSSFSRRTADGGCPYMGLKTSPALQLKQILLVLHVRHSLSQLVVPGLFRTGHAASRHGSYAAVPFFRTAPGNYLRRRAAGFLE